MKQLMQHKNNVASTNLHIPAINVKLLHSLSDLPKYGIDAVSMSRLPNAPITEILENMHECRLNYDRTGFIRFIQQVVNQKQHLFNVYAHQLIMNFVSQLSDYGDHEFCNQYHQASINYKNLLIKLINLHINECNLYQKHHNHKKIRYMLRRQKQMQPVECVWCTRGCCLFNLLFTCNSTLIVQLPSMENLAVIDFYHSYNQSFYYCPLHLTESMTVKSSIINHCLNTKYSFSASRLFGSMFVHMIGVGSLAIQKTPNMIGSLHLGTAILDLMTKLMRLGCTKIEIVVSLIDGLFLRDQEKDNRNFLTCMRDVILSTFYWFCDCNVDSKIYKLTCVDNRNPFELIKNYEIEYGRFRSICSDYKYKQLQVGVHDTSKFNLFEKAIKYYTPSQLKNFIALMIQSPSYPIVKLHIIRTFMTYRDHDHDLREHSYSIYEYLAYSQFINNLNGETMAYWQSGVCNDHQRAKNLFDQIFANMLKNQKDDFESNQDRYTYNNYVYTITEIFEPFLWYAMFLFNIGSKKGCKYFEFCLNFRPLSGYLHFQYSMYLHQIIKDYRLSYYHLKLAKQLGSNAYTLSLGTNTTTVLKYENQLKYMTKVLCLKLNKQHRCDCISCNKIISIQARVCKGCRSAYYCGKKCQKIDWLARHKKICVSKFVQSFEQKEHDILKRAHFMMNELIKQF